MLDIIIIYFSLWILACVCQSENTLVLRWYFTVCGKLRKTKYYIYIFVCYSFWTLGDGLIDRLVKMRILNCKNLLLQLFVAWIECWITRLYHTDVPISYVVLISYRLVKIRSYSLKWFMGWSCASAHTVMLLTRMTTEENASWPFDKPKKGIQGNDQEIFW